MLIGEREKRFLSYFLLMFAFWNIVVDIPDVGVRTTGFCCTMALYAVSLLYNVNRQNIVLRYATYIVVAASLLNVAYSIRTTFYYVSLWEILVSPFVSKYFNKNSGINMNMIVKIIPITIEIIKA